ncbi:MAG: helix-turn-helix domain-containing protein [Actinomycetota bacterium]|nr:helix-turn-helix domain-containing protein [Actinomycetota bacterium]
MNLADLPDVLTVEQTAGVLQVSTWSVYDLVRREQLHSLRVGRLVRITKPELMRFVGAPGREGAGPTAGSPITTLTTRTT